MKPKNVQNNQLLTVQEQYLRKHKITIDRLLFCVSFFWECFCFSGKSAQTIDGSIVSFSPAHTESSCV